MSIKAISTLYSNNHVVIGTLKFVQEGEKLEISGNLSTLIPESTFFLHIHEFGDISNGVNSTGQHFNPHKVKCGNFSDKIRHVGDLGEITTDEDGKADVLVEDKDCLVKLNGPTSIVGRSVVVTRKDDQGENKTDENNKVHIGFGVIGIMK